jgi:hypothetical protein
MNGPSGGSFNTVLNRQGLLTLKKFNFYSHESPQVPSVLFEVNSLYILTLDFFKDLPYY